VKISRIAVATRSIDHNGGMEASICEVWLAASSTSIEKQDSGFVRLDDSIAQHAGAGVKLLSDGGGRI
jgi:hypothetical protein